MRLLIDTHFALWLASDPGKLTIAETALLESADSEVSVSAVSIWELRLKWNSLHRSGARKGAAAPEDVLAALENDIGCMMLPLTAAHAAVVLQVPLQHNDPFDELLLAQAQAEGLRLLTRDRALVGHPLAVAA